MFKLDKKSLLLASLALVLTLGLFGCGKKVAPVVNSNISQNQNANVNTNNATNTVATTTEINVNTANKINTAEDMKLYCTSKPVPTEIGRDVYPTNTKRYGNIDFLGELFTADDCGKERLSKIFGVLNNDYTLWPDILLQNEPDSNLILVLKEIGFELGSTCENSIEKKCKHWSLKKTVPLEKILKLKPFAQEIKSSGCINCG